MSGIIAYILAMQYTDDQIAAMPEVFHVKPAVDTKDDLPATGNKRGDVRKCRDTGDEYYWDGTIWEPFGSALDDQLSTTSERGVKNKVIKAAIDAAVTQINSKIGQIEAELGGKYVKPQTGIPSSDMSSGVQNTLNKAESAVQPAALVPLALKSESGKRIDLEIDPDTFELVAKLYDVDNNLISTSTVIDLPIEQLVINVTFDTTTNELVITLKNGTVTRVPLSAIISGLATESWVTSNFVAKETGKGLSTNDFDNNAKEKLDGVEAKAEVNINYTTEDYQGVDLTQKFALEIGMFADEWQWIKNRIATNNFTGIHIHDYIPVTCTNGYVLKEEVAGINTYKGSGATEIGKHIDFISKDLWPDAVQFNPVNYNNGIGLDKFTADGSTTVFQLTHRTATTFPSGLSKVLFGTAEQATDTYSYNATTGQLTFNEAPASGTVIKAVWTTPIEVPVLASGLHAFLMSDKCGVPNEAAADPALIEVDYTNGGIWKYLPDKLKAVIADKWAYPGVRYTQGSLRTSENDYKSYNLGKLWIPDEMEVYGTVLRSYVYAGCYSRQYPCFMNGNRKKGSGNGGGRTSWWLAVAYSGFSTLFCVVDSYGLASYGNASNSYRVPVCFRITG